MGIAELVFLPLVVAGRFLVEVAAVVVGLMIWERWFKRWRVPAAPARSLRP